MEIKIKNLKFFFAGCVGLILLAWGLNHMALVGGFMENILGILSPFLMGAAIAFIMNVPLRGIERVLKKHTRLKKNAVRICSMILTYLGVALILWFVVMTVIPELINTFVQINQKIPDFIAQVEEWGTGIIEKYPEITDDLSELGGNWTEINDTVVNFLKNGITGLLTSTVGVASSLISAVATLVIAVIFSLYILFQKEKLGRQVKKILYAYLPLARAERCLEVMQITSRIFSGFIAGQCTEAVVFGCLCFVGMTLFRFPYAVSISVLIGFTTLIPIFGAIFGTVVGALLILVTSPIKAVGFVIMILILQQIDGNLIYPRIVGNSVGLPGIWVMVAVTVGGSLMGVFGMLVFVPLASVCYCLLRENVNKRLRKRDIQAL
ncbi:MAG: AI-2E family transporter [Eubacteriales bacterium]|nr:AI-2E family transporter [Eubacteriales bacterium]